MNSAMSRVGYRLDPREIEVVDSIVMHGLVGMARREKTRV